MTLTYVSCEAFPPASCSLSSRASVSAGSPAFSYALMSVLYVMWSGCRPASCISSYTCSALSSRLPAAHALMTLLYVIVFGVQSTSLRAACFMLLNTSNASCHLPAVAQAEIKALQMDKEFESRRLTSEGASTADTLSRPWYAIQPVCKCFY